MPLNELGESIPADTAHAVSVSLPTWKSNVGYEEGEEWVLSKMKTGYPRFYIHDSIARFADTIITRHGKAGERAMVFPSHSVASRCVDFLRCQVPSLGTNNVRIVELVPNSHSNSERKNTQTSAKICAVLLPEHCFKVAKVFWQHSGEGVSSRQAEFAHRAYEEGALVEGELAQAGAINSNRLCKGPRRYQRGSLIDKAASHPTINASSAQSYPEPEVNSPLEGREYSQFIEERFGRNLDLSFVRNAKLAVRRRIAGSLIADVDLKEAMNMPGDAQKSRQVMGFSEDDVYLYPTGMSSIFNTHRTLMAARGQLESICFGFPYIDTLKILQKWGPGCLFYGHGSSQDLDDLERRLERGDQYLALFCEFPSNPLLKSPDLKRIRLLADRYGFTVVVDETVGNFMNVHVLPFADVVVSSLTKVFSGDSNVMGGSCVLNPRGPYYKLLKDTLAVEYEDNYWAEDAIFMERNSRDFVSRIDRININAEAICGALKAHPRVMEVHYPKYSPTRPNYEYCRNSNGGYGGLLSVTFFSTPEAVTFFDRLETAKGPSLGTNFTLCCPFTLLAHYTELEWASQFGVEVDLIRVSVGLEDTSELIMKFERALEAVTQKKPSAGFSENAKLSVASTSTTRHPLLVTPNHYLLRAAMAPLKRARRAIDGGYSEGEEIGSASSSTREVARKRVRISQSKAGSHSRSVRAYEDGDSDDLQGEVDEDDSGEDMGYERRRDAEFEDLEDEDLDTQRATQIIQQRNLKSMENVPADNGIIESVTCINFMCHNKLYVSFGPLINFIIGYNGSGKSAVLTAITLCLGGKANSTNRGGSLKAFVKEGRESATLIVKLKNRGYGFQQETYGESIIVERHFSKAGSSGFKLKNVNGRVISTKKADLEEICDYFALQIDNPMNVLTQDMSRQFLNNSSPAEKYRFFVKGVQLEQLDQDYQLLEETIDQIESKLKTRDDDIQILENRAKKARAKLEMSDKHDKLRDRIRDYMRQMAWSQVEQEEKKLADADVQLQEAISNIEKAERKASTVDQAFDEANQAYEEGVEAVREANESIGPLQEKKKQLKDRFDDNKGELMQLHLEQRTIRDHLKDADSRIKNYKAEIATENQRLEDANGGNHVRRVAEIEAAKRQVVDIRREYDQQSSLTTGLGENVRIAEEELRRSSVPIDAKKTDIKGCEDVIESLVRDRGQHLSAFHPNIPRLLHAIRNEPRFREKPVGPIGNHIRLLKPVWSSILERSFGATLTSFVVTSKSDQDILTHLMKRESCSCPILIGNNQPIDTSNSEPDPQYNTSLRVLEIDNDVVKRQLIINQAIEQTILVEDRLEAQRVMYGGVRPRNVKQCYCFNESRKGWGIRFGYRGNDESSAPMQPLGVKPRMKTDVDSQINYQRSISRELQRELNELERHKRDLQERLHTHKQALQTHEKQHKDLHLKIQRAEETAERLQDELERDTAQDGRLQALEGYLREAEEDIAIIEGSYEEAVTQKDKLNAIAKELSSQMKEIDSELADMEAKIKKTEARALKLSHKRQTSLLEKNSAFQKIDDAKLEKTRAESKRESQANRVNEFVEQARKVSERVPVDPGETPGSLDKKLDKLTNDLDRFNREIGGTPEQIAQEAQETADAYRTAQKQLEQLDEIGQMLKFALLERQNRWRKFRRYISARARAQFTYLLSERSFRGALKTDHQLHTLDLQVEPDETRSGKGRQTKTLSGGEKSFSTICLLLSLWEAMGSPIRCLDEFDVFMDNVNRDVSMRMMINAARRSVGRQYVLITPNSMGNIDVAEDVKIIKYIFDIVTPAFLTNWHGRLSDPERGQTTLPFENQRGS